ncbi:hypothetical protein B0H63DRAFT_546008 [Podospora didyma]|uniref:Uncharacterized protein n=1 Tax=Podospora didyma TaxID=330526 RepID=A0AAE0NH34_9PEZI|nr:hypothetical protein B0H63DRAFT_546008 [Podospora didyma]
MATYQESDFESASESYWKPDSGSDTTHGEQESDPDSTAPEDTNSESTTLEDINDDEPVAELIEKTLKEVASMKPQLTSFMSTRQKINEIHNSIVQPASKPKKKQKLDTSDPELLLSMMEAKLYFVMEETLPSKEKISPMEEKISLMQEKITSTTKEKVIEPTIHENLPKVIEGGDPTSIRRDVFTTARHQDVTEIQSRSRGTENRNTGNNCRPNLTGTPMGRDTNTSGPRSYQQHTSHRDVADERRIDPYRPRLPAEATDSTDSDEI